MKINENVHEISSNVSNAFLIVEGDELALVDTGISSSARHIFNYIAGLGRSASQLKHILITHSDTDHVRGIPALVAASGARVYASRIEAEAMAEGKASRELKLHGLAKVLMTVIRPLMKAKPVQVDEIVKAGDALSLLGGLEVIATPGHTPGHVSFYARRDGILFAGDSLRALGERLVVSSGANTWDEGQAKESARAQAALNPKIVCVGHGKTVFEAEGKIPGS